MNNRNLSRILSSWVFLRYGEELTSRRRSPVARGVTKLNGSSRLAACCKLNGATSQRNTTRKVQIGSKHFQFTAKLASYWNHHQSFKTSRTTNLYAYTRSFICSSFTLRLSRKAIKHMRKAFSHSVRRSSPNASRTGVFYWPLKINFWIYESAVYYLL